MSELSLEWLYAIGVTCFWMYFPFRLRKDFHSMPRWAAVAFALCCLPSWGGFLWFLLWMVTDELVPHGLWGFGLTIVGFAGIWLAGKIEAKYDPR